MEGVVPRKPRKSKEADNGRPIEDYEHKDKTRLNNPPVGLAKKEEDQGPPKKTYEYDPHLDPQLVWSGKAEHTSFEVPTVSLHVHERIEPRTIIEAVRKQSEQGPAQGSLFSSPEENPPLRNAIEFYKHSHHWTNRLIAGDSLLVMNSLLEKEGMAGKVQMIYIDPPYGIKYGSNFQPFINKRDVKDGSDEDLTQEPEQIRAFRDTWELGIHSYLSYLRDRLLLARELLCDSGSVFVQISDDNLHRVKSLMDEVFGAAQAIVTIVLKKKGATTPTDPVNDFILWYGKNRDLVTNRVKRLYQQRSDPEDDPKFNTIMSPSREMARIRQVSKDDIRGRIDVGWRWARVNYPIVSQHFHQLRSQPYLFCGKTKQCGSNRQWSFDVPVGLDRLKQANRLFDAGGLSLAGIVFWHDWPYIALSNVWNDLKGEENPDYVVQTAWRALERCLLMTTDPGDLVFDPTCGSGTTAYVAEQWGRRWITCDTSRVAIALAKQRLMTATYDYYELAKPKEGVGSGFNYATVPHITLKSIAHNEQIDKIHEKWQPKLDEIRNNLNQALNQKWEEWEIPLDADPDWPEATKKLRKDWIETRKERQKQIDESIQKIAPTEILYDKPITDAKKARVTGPFTVEAVPAATVKAVEDLSTDQIPEANASIARTGESLRQAEWRDELFKTGVRGKGGQMIQFSRVETLPGTRWLHAEAETKEDQPQKVVVSFGPEHAPLGSSQVNLALEEAESLRPAPKIILFASFHFDPEAARNIEETKWPGVTLLKAQMNTDLLTEDLKKKRASNQSFWLVGSPDVTLTRIDDEKWQVEILGYDYYNTKTGAIESGGANKIAMWMLDTDYDGRSVFPRQVFFPMADDKSGWSKLARNLKAEIDADLIENYRGTISLPFKGGEFNRVAVKVIDDRGVESVKIVGLDK
jgi:adenine-specific DNA-methyltransferase